MSTILKALRRLEEDRQGERQRDLRREVASRTTAWRGDVGGVRGTSAPWLGAVVGAVLAVVGVGAWYFAGGLRAAVPEPPPVEIRVSRPDPDTERVKAWTSAPRSVPPPVAAARPRPAAVEAPPARPSIDSALRTEAPSSAPRAPEPSFAVSRPDPIPVLRVRKIVWHPSPGRRLAVVEAAGGDGPVELREGEALGSLVVAEITPTGVTFERDGVQLVRRLGGATPKAAGGR